MRPDLVVWWLQNASNYRSHIQQFVQQACTCRRILSQLDALCDSSSQIRQTIEHRTVFQRFVRTVQPEIKQDKMKVDRTG